METHSGNNKTGHRSPTPNLVSRQTRKTDTVIKVNGIDIGGREIVIIAGPCILKSLFSW